MDDLQAILTSAFFARDEQSTAATPDRFHFYFDTYIAYTWLVGISDFLKEIDQSSRLAVHWLAREGLVASALAVEGVFPIDLLDPHRWELAQLIQSKAPRPDQAEAIRALNESIGNQWPDGIRIVDRGDLEISLDMQAGYDTKAIEMFCKLALLSKVDVDQNIAVIKRFFAGADSGVPLDTPLSDIVDDELYRHAYLLSGKTVEHRKSKSRAIDCAAVVCLSYLVKRFNQSDLQGPAPIFICAPGTNLYALFLEVCKRASFRERFLLTNPSGLGQAFAFQTPLLFATEVIGRHYGDGAPGYSREELETRRDHWSLLGELRHRLEARHGPINFESTAVHWKALEEAEWQRQWITWLRTRYEGAEYSQSIRELVFSVKYDEEFLSTKIEALTKTIIGATAGTKDYVTTFGWRKEVDKTLEIFRGIRGRSREPNSELLLLRLYGFAFGIGELSVSSNEGMWSSLLRDQAKFVITEFVDTAWLEFQSLKRDREGSDQTGVEAVQTLLVMLWIGVRYEANLFEKRAIAELAIEVLSAIPSRLQKSAWFLAIRFRLAYFDYCMVADDARSAYGNEMEELCDRLFVLWEDCGCLTDRLLVGFPASYSQMVVGRLRFANSSVGASSGNLIEREMRVFRIADMDYWKRAVSILSELYADWEGENQRDPVVGSLLENQLLYFYASGKDSFSTEDIEKMHVLAGRLRRRRNTGVGWIWEFDDTLAVYCLRIGCIMKDKEDKAGHRDWLKRAKKHIAEAMELAPQTEELLDVDTAIDEAISLL